VVPGGGSIGGGGETQRGDEGVLGRARGEPEDEAVRVLLETK